MSLTVQNLLDAQCPQPLAEILSQSLIEVNQKLDKQDIKINEQGVKLNKVVTHLTEVRHDLVKLDKKIIAESKKITDHFESVIEKKQDDMKTFISNLFEGLKQK